MHRARFSRRVAQRVALLACVVLLSSCALWDWMFKTENPATKPVELTPIKDSLNVQTTWRVSIGSGRGVYLQPAVLENGVRVMVPPHIEAGTRIVVDVYERAYVGKAG